MRNSRTNLENERSRPWLDAGPSIPHSAFHIPHLLHAPTGAGSATRRPITSAITRISRIS